MFTGIIETQGVITAITQQENNKTYWLKSDIAAELQPDQSLAHDGVCLTVEAINGGTYRVTAIDETLAVTALNNWKEGQPVNLERCVQMNGRLDGHLVQGHVDTTAECTSVTDARGSKVFTFKIDQKFAPLIIEKGSIAINGISLTLFNTGINEFSVAIIPYTMEHTNIGRVQPGSIVNIEFDLIGKYLMRQRELPH